MTNSCGIPLPAIPWKLTVSVFHITITEYIYATQQLSSHARHDCPIVGILWRFDPCGNRMEKTIKRQCWTWRSRGCGEETRAAGEGGNGSRRRSDGETCPDPKNEESQTQTKPTQPPMYPNNTRSFTFAVVAVFFAVHMVEATRKAPRPRAH